MLHLSELHGAVTHLAVVAIPVYLLVLLCRRAGVGGEALAAVEPWVVGAAVAGTLLAGATGLLVWGQAQTTLRDGHFAIGTAHFWLGIALTVVVAVLAGWRLGGCSRVATRTGTRCWRAARSRSWRCWRRAISADA